jgi:hypothetical protein
MNKFLETCDHPNLNQKDIDYLNRSITSNEIEVKIVSQKIKFQDLTESLLNSTINLKNNRFQNSNFPTK